MRVKMRTAEYLSQERIREFLGSSGEIEFAGRERTRCMAGPNARSGSAAAPGLSKKARGWVRAHRKNDGLSPARITRPIRAYLDAGLVKKVCHRHKFIHSYTNADIVLLVGVDRARRLSGPATRWILERGYEVDKPEFARLAGISVSHLYNLCRSAPIANGRRCSSLRGRTRCRLPSGADRTLQGRPGFLRVHTVH